MEEDVNESEKCANPGCGRIAASRSLYCETCELEWILFRRDLRGGNREKEGLAVESR